MLVRIHGGGFRSGQGAVPWYNGTSFAQRGNIGTVSINYLRDVVARVSIHAARRVLELTPREWKHLGQDSGAQAAVCEGR